MIFADVKHYIYAAKIWLFGTELMNYGVQKDRLTVMEEYTNDNK